MTTDADRCSLYVIARDDGTYTAASYLSLDDTRAMGGIPESAVMGVVRRAITDDAPIPWQLFVASPGFLVLFHAFLGRQVAIDEALSGAAVAQDEGLIYLIDLRTPGPAGGPVPPEDIIGLMRVSAGAVVAGSYVASDKHRLFTVNGPTRLPASLHAALLDELRRLPV